MTFPYERIAVTGGSGDADDPMLVDEIRSKILTRRGIQARSDEILITMGTQNSLYLICRLLADRSVTTAIEEPGNAEVRELLRQSGAKVMLQPVDADGIVVDEKLNDCALARVHGRMKTPRVSMLVSWIEP